MACGGGGGGVTAACGGGGAGVTAACGGGVCTAVVGSLFTGGVEAVPDGGLPALLPVAVPVPVVVPPCCGTPGSA